MTEQNAAATQAPGAAEPGSGCGQSTAEPATAAAPICSVCEAGEYCEEHPVTPAAAPEYGVTLTEEQVTRWMRAWWDGSFQEAKNKICRQALAAIRLAKRAEAWEEKFQSECNKHDQTVKRAMDAEKRVAELALDVAGYKAGEECQKQRAEAAERELAELRNSNYAMSQACDEAHAQFLDMESKLHAAQEDRDKAVADAERWRYYREHHITVNHHSFIQGFLDTPQRIDSVTDSAIRALKDKP